VPSDGSYSKDSYYEYVEHGSKNYQGKFAEIDSNKVTRAYAQPGLRHCPVMIIDLYISKLPLQPKAFYMQPLSKVPDDLARPWYQSTAIGVNVLKNMMVKISQLAGLSTHYTNHSLRATSATWMFSAGVPEKIIAEFTGHKSSKALQQYEHTSTAQVQAAGLAIAKETPFGHDAKAGAMDDIAAMESSAVEDVKPDFAAIQKLMPAFAGNLSNCTININVS
jgi:hypothetical protein